MPTVNNSKTPQNQNQSKTKLTASVVKQDPKTQKVNTKSVHIFWGHAFLQAWDWQVSDDQWKMTTVCLSSFTFGAGVSGSHQKYFLGCLEIIRSISRGVWKPSEVLPNTPLPITETGQVDNFCLPSFTCQSAAWKKGVTLKICAWFVLSYWN